MANNTAMYSPMHAPLYIRVNFSRVYIPRSGIAEWNKCVEVNFSHVTLLSKVHQFTFHLQYVPIARQLDTTVLSEIAITC